MKKRKAISPQVLYEILPSRQTSDGPCGLGRIQYELGKGEVPGAAERSLREFFRKTTILNISYIRENPFSLSENDAIIGKIQKTRS